MNEVGTHSGPPGETESEKVGSGKASNRTATLFPLAPITVVIGHYGVGKTNFSINLALDAAARGYAVTLMDLDVVNPYFRSSDYRELLEGAGVHVVSPIFAGTTIDSPSLSGAVYTAIEDAIRQGDDGETCVIIDAGGDDVGATALGRFAPRIAEGDHEVLYVVNRYRNLTQEPREAAELLGEIEAKAGLSATGIVNNSHLKEDTTEEVVVAGTAFANEVSERLGLPIVCTAVPKRIVDQKNGTFSKNAAIQNVYPVQVYVRTPWGT
ncbi:nucleotide-binding protein [Raoultibacter phocaeensis]|uniref:nucleotide-binding protein n=1 Tax=Raoultibacter phocaeensis TaxID=2479841 RepID=UPI0011181D0B|nr:ParA family protein [Raoultibacter phocaeensis]